MFTRGKDGKAAGGISFIGAEARIAGDLSTDSQLQVDGRIEGNVVCTELCQGESGAIRGNIAAEQARIAGLVDGAVDARILVLEATARVTGDVSYETLTIAAGARIDGRLARRGAAAEPARQAPLLVAAS